ncbi:UNVERIFIED_CONTAM: hypothetical protein LK11_13595 [Mumia flava]|nr:LuxR family transcriptional regulator [Mumia flava]
MADWRPTTPLVGRVVELDKLLAAVGVDDPDARGAVLLSGDAGMGKTRLLRETAVRASDLGHRVLVGHCVDLGDAGIPYQPFAEVLSGLEPPTRAALGERSPVLAGLLGGGDPPEADRGELFAAVTASLETLATAAPVLLVVEDAHWADASTRHLLRYVLTQRFDGPVRVVVSYRSDDLHRRHPLRSDVAEWGRLPDVQRLDLRPLAADEVRDLAVSRGRTLSTESLDAIVRRAGGNAFIVEELLDVEDGPLPWTLAELLLVRLDRLDDDARQLVRVMACAGGEVDDDLLAQVAGLDPASLETAIRSALDHRILSRTTRDTYVFRHALLGEVVRDDLLPGERRRLHAAYVAALDPQAHAADVARHAMEAGMYEAAFTASVTAAERATRVAGHEEAAQHYERALGLVDSAPEGTDTVELVLAASEALIAAGYVRRAGDLVRDHIDRLDPEVAVDDRVRLLIAFGTACSLSERNRETAETLETLFTLVPEEPTALRAQVENLAAYLAMSERRDDEALRWSEQAIALARRLGLRRVIDDAVITQTRVRSRTGDDPAANRRRLEELVETTREQGNEVGELRAHHILAFHFHDRGELEDAEREFLAAMELAERAGRRWAPYGFDGRFFGSLTAYLLGQWDLVDTLGDVERLRPPTVAAAALRAIGLLVSAGRAADDGIATADELRTHWSRDVALAIYAGTAAIDLAPDAESAMRWHDDLVRCLTEDWHDRYAPARVRMSGLALGRLAAAATTARGAQAEALGERADALIRDAERSVQTRGPFGPEGGAWQVRVAAEDARLRRLLGEETDVEAETETWRDCVARFDELGHVFEAARSRARLAAVLQARGDRAGAAGAAEEAWQSASRLRAAPLQAELEAVVPRRRSKAPVADESETSGPELPTLTPREREVLARLTEGLTNGQIASRLFISTKTASVHVSNILAKLGVATRTEAAAIAARHPELLG